MRGESSALSNMRSAPAPGAREVSTFFPGKNLHNQHLRQPPQTWQIDRQKSLSQQTRGSDLKNKNPLARHRRCGVYCGARETVGGSSVSSGCWGEDSNHEYGWARRTPTYVAPIRFLHVMSPMHRLEISLKQNARRSEINIGRGLRRKLGQLIPLKAPRRVGIISNKRVFDLYGG